MVLFWYILRTHVAPFLFGTSVIMALFLLQYIMRWVDQLSSKGLDVATIAEFMILNLSWIVVLAIPIGVLFSTLMAFGAMSAAHDEGKRYGALQNDDTCHDCRHIAMGAFVLVHGQGASRYESAA